MKRIHIDWEKCTGCMRCMLICSALKEGLFQPAKARIYVVDSPRDGMSIPLICYQCENAPCKVACPVDALERAENGIISVHEELCTGCGECETACPYGMIAVVNNVAMKCDLCSGDPQCVKVCVPEALVFDEGLSSGRNFDDVEVSGDSAFYKREERASRILQELAVNR